MKSGAGGGCKIFKVWHLSCQSIAVGRLCTLSPPGRRASGDDVDFAARKTYLHGGSPGFAGGRRQDTAWESCPQAQIDDITRARGGQRLAVPHSPREPFIPRGPNCQAVIKSCAKLRGDTCYRRFAYATNCARDNIVRMLNDHA